MALSTNHRFSKRSPSLSSGKPSLKIRSLSEAVTTNNLSELRPGDVVMDSDNPYVEPQSTVLIPDTELEGPTTASESPNVPTAAVVTEPSGESTSMLAWFVGGGVAILALLVLFGRRIRNRFGPTPVGAIAATAASTSNRMLLITISRMIRQPRRTWHSMPTSFWVPASRKVPTWISHRTSVSQRRQNLDIELPLRTGTGG